MSFFLKPYLKDILSYLIGVLLLGVLIELTAYFTILPDVHSSLEGIKILWNDGPLKHNILVSSARWLIGWSIGGFIGIVLGYLTGRIFTIQLFFEGFFVIIRAIPFICLVPISILIFGLEETGKFFIVAWASAAVTWIVVHNVALNIEPHHRWRALSLGASRKRWILDVLVPATSEGVFSGLRTSLSIGLIVVAVAEMSGVYEASSGYWWSEGLGYRMFKSLDEARNDLLMATIISFAFLGILGDIVFRLIWKSFSSTRFFIIRRKIAKRINIAKMNIKGFEFDASNSFPIELNEIFARYNDNIVINGLSLNIAPGETLSIVGPSGCGKTTLLRAMGHFTDNIFKVNNGVKIGDKYFNHPGAQTGIVMQEAPVFEHMTVWENILFGNTMRSINSFNRSLIALYLLREFNLENQASQIAKTLSGGQRQRVALAMTIANKPKLLLLDEPFGALDAITRRTLQKFYESKIKGKISAIFVTHDVEEALLISNCVRIGVLKDGEVLETNKGNLTAHEWELTENFNSEKAKLIKALERIK